MPPRIDVCMTRLDAHRPLPHDAGGALLQLGRDAAECLERAQQAAGEEGRGLLQRALALRLREHAGWLAVRTQEHPAGDRLGAAKAAAGIGVLHLKLLAIEEAREWFERAHRECPPHAQHVRDVVRYNREQLERIALVRYVHRRVRLHGLVAKPAYNGLCGVVLCHSQARWTVLLEPADGAEPRRLQVRPENVEFV